MSNNLQNFNDIYASLSQSAYPTAPKPLPIEVLSKDKRDTLLSGQSVKINYSTSGKDSNGEVTQGGQVLVGPPTPDYQGLSKGGVVHLQPEEQKRVVA